MVTNTILTYRYRGMESLSPEMKAVMDCFMPNLLHEKDTSGK